MTQATRIRTVVLGCGFHGTSMAEAIARTPSLQLVACVDPDEVAASRAALSALGAATYAAFDDLLAGSEFDAAVIATPHHLLAPLAIAAIKANKHVLIEKPVAMTDSEAADIETAANGTGLVIMAGYSMRFSMGRYLRDLVDSGVLGSIHALSGAFTMPPLKTGWESRPETGGGPLAYVGSHLVDMVLWLVGDEPAEVTAMMTRRADTSADNVTAFQMRFASGAVAQCLVSQSAPGFSFEVKLIGDKGRATLRGGNFLQFEIEIVGSEAGKFGEPTYVRPALRRDNIEMMLVPELREFGSAILEGRPPAITLAPARAVLRVLDAVNAAAVGGAAAALPPYPRAPVACMG
jgi:predicted dehydrogenase